MDGVLVSLKLSILGAADAQLPCEFLLVPCASGLDESVPQMYPPPTELAFVLLSYGAESDTSRVRHNDVS